MRSVYIAAMRLLRSVLGPTGALSAMEHRLANPRWRHLRSLFAIYDLDDMIHLDLPWWSFEATAKVEAFLASRPARVFEYGSGASTFWLSKRAVSVTSVESDPGWFENLSRYLAAVDNVSLQLQPPEPLGPDVETPFGSQHRRNEGLSFERFVRTIECEAEPFDLIVIDGRAREACLHAALPWLKPDGILLFDDTVRQRYKDAIADHPEFNVDRCYGLAASLPYRNETTLLSRRG